jgi:hypothetical protein
LTRHGRRKRNTGKAGLCEEAAASDRVPAPFQGFMDVLIPQLMLLLKHGNVKHTRETLHKPGA